jgi:ATP-binding cassette subfamily F protein 2
MVREGLTKRVESDRVVKFQFTNVGKLPPPVLQFSDVTFGYSKDKVLYRNVDLGADLDSRVAIVSMGGVGGWAGERLADVRLLARFLGGS